MSWLSGLEKLGGTCIRRVDEGSAGRWRDSVLLARSINYPNISLTAIQDQLGRRFPAEPHH